MTESVSGRRESGVAPLSLRRADQRLFSRIYRLDVIEDQRGCPAKDDYMAEFYIERLVPAVRKLMAENQLFSEHAA